MKFIRKFPCMLWTPEGVWLQTYTSEGQVKSSYCGRLSFYSVAKFAAERKLAFYFERPPAGSSAPVNSPGARTAVAVL